MKNSTEISILGQQFAVKSSAPPEEVERVVAFVNEQLAEVTAGHPTSDTLAAAVLALMNVAGALLRSRQERDEEAGQITRSLESLIEKVEKACGD